MKIKNIFIAIVIIVIAVAVIFVTKTSAPNRAAKKGVVVKQDKIKGKAAVAIPEKKVFQKGMGGLTVKAKNSKGGDIGLRVKAFRSEDRSSSVFVASFSSQKMQELSPGTYDIELDTVPAKIFKNIKVSEGSETVEDLGALTGAINVKALNSKKKAMYVLFKITYPKSNLTIATAAANRPFEIVSGVYDIEIETLPRQVKKEIRVDSGKETTLDLGIVSGALNVKAADDNGKDVRLAVRLRNSGTNTIIASGITNTSIEVAPGTYDIEVMSAPSQMKKEVKIAAGEDTNIEFIVNPPVSPSSVKAPPSAKKK